MAIVRWDPFRDMAQISDRLNRMFADESLRTFRDDAYGAWIPPVDILEKGENLIIRAELPGVQKDEIDVRIENGILSLRGERKRESEGEEDGAYRLERVYGSFSRSFALPTTVDSSRVAATFKEGVLEISIPKSEEAKPKRVKIEAA